MKKAHFLFKIAMALLAFVLPLSCDTGGGGGGGGGGNSAQTSKTNITITIPSATSSSSDINLLGDFLPEYATENFRYEIYFKKGTKEIARKEGTPGKTVTFDNVTYDTYDFFLDIYVDSNKITKLDTLRVLNKTVSASNNTVTFPDMSTSTYKNWYFVKDVNDLTRAWNEINAEGSPYNTSNKAILCLLATIEDPRADSVKKNSAIQLVENGFELEPHLYNITISGAIVGGTVSSDRLKASAGKTVTLTVTPNETPEKYRFKSLTFGSVATVTELADDGTRTFEMPESDVTVTADFIRVYTINYNFNDGTTDLEESVEYTIDDFFSDAYTLPTKDDISKDGYLFYGWYESNDFSGDKVTEISSDNIADKTFYARWINSIFVKNGGDENKDGLTESTAVGTLAEAINKINVIGEETFDWKIQIVSDLSTTQDMSAAMVSAVSIIVEGNGHTLDASDSGDRGLKIENTSIPITIKNLTITGGYAAKGAGVYAKGSPVNLTLSTGVVVTGNTYDGVTSYGTGVCAENSATVTITENAEISNNVSSKTTACTTYGGGVCALYSTVVIEKNAVIQGNKARYGAGVCCYGSGSVTISDSVTINANTYPDGGMSACGGGVYLTGNGALLTMDGGTISANANNEGGGVYIGEGTTFTLNGGTITGNTISTTGNGSGVFSKGTFKMNGGTIASDNDIYLGTPSSSSSPMPTIEVGGTISSSVAVKLVASRCNSGETVLTGSAMSANYSKFTLTNAGLYKIGSAGTLVYKDLNDFTTDDIDYCVTLPDAETITSSKDYSLSNLANKTKLILYKGAGADAGDGTVYPYYGIIKIVTGSSSPSTISFNGNDSDYTLDWNQSSWQAWDLKKKSIASFVDEHYDVLYFSNPNLQIYPNSGSGTTSLSIYEIDLPTP